MHRGYRVFIENRQNVIKMQAQQSDGSEWKISNPHKNLTKHHTCRANFLLARHNTQPLVALNLCFRHLKKKKRKFYLKRILKPENILDLKGVVPQETHSLYIK